MSITRSSGTVWRLPTSTLPTVGLLLGWAASLTPGVLPRPWALQSIVSGLGIMIGFVSGLVLERLWVRLSGSVSTRSQGVVSKAAIGAAIALMVWVVVLHHLWQIDVRSLMGVDGSSLLYLAATLGGGAATGYALIVLARILRRGWLALVALVSRQASPRAAGVLAFLVLSIGALFVVDELLLRHVLPALGERFQDSYERMDSEVSRPVSAAVSGSPGSLVGWESMGRQGRAFVAAAPPALDLERFARGDVQDPIRIYVGLDSARSIEERVALAIDELDRTGGFDRRVLLVVAPTGTGWIDPYAVAPIELMYGGDTAAVAVQYSNLPSWVLLLGNQDHAVETQRELFGRIRERLDAMDPLRRPRLVLYGQSLGSFGQEAIFEGFSDVLDATDGVLWVGPPRSNRHWQQLMSRSDNVSPVWRPVVDDGRSVRFGPDLQSWLAVSGEWTTPRVIYLQHPSDPITWLSPDIITSRPEWLDDSRGPDVSRWTPFVPVVTFLQVSIDLAVGTSVPLGHGHSFGSEQSDAWSAILPPHRWEAADTPRLRDLVEALVDR